MRLARAPQSAKMRVGCGSLSTREFHSLLDRRRVHWAAAEGNAIVAKTILVVAFVVWALLSVPMAILLWLASNGNGPKWLIDTDDRGVERWDK